MLTTRQARRASRLLNVALFVVPVVLIASAVAHRSWTLGVAGGLAALLMVVMTLVSRTGGETTRLVGGRVDDERYAEIQVRAWAHVGQFLMVVLVAILMVGVAIDGEEALRAGTRWIGLLVAGGLVGAGSVVWLARRS